MALNTAAVQEHFKIFGKLIFIHNLVTTHQAAWEKAVAGLYDQGMDAVAADYDLARLVFNPFASQVHSVINGISNAPNTVKNAVTLYLKNEVAEGVDLTSSATPADIIDGLIDEMNTNGDTVGASGTYSDGFAAYFNAQYSKTLPQSGSPNVPNSYIDDDVV